MSRNALQTLMQNYSTHFVVYVGLVLFIIVASFPFTQARPVELSDDSKLEGFWPLERSSDLTTFRWSRGAGIVWFREQAYSSRALLNIRMSSPLSSSDQSTPLNLGSDERSIGIIQVPNQWRSYHIMLAPAGLAWRTPNLDLISPTQVSGSNDLRQLGLAISAVQLQASGSPLVLPLLIQAIYLLLLMHGVYSFIRPQPLATIISIGIGSIVTALWMYFPTLLRPIIPSLWHSTLIATALGALIWYPRRSQLLRQAGPAAALGVVLVVLVTLTTICSLFWRMLHDAPLLMYMAWLINTFDAVPYRDIFDQNMPGALLFYVALGRAFGYSDPGFRIADVLVLVVLSGLTWIWCARIQRVYATFSALLFAWVYLQFGPSISLQRDFVLLIPIAGALVVAGWLKRPLLTFFLIGLCCGVATTIKPQAALALPIIYWYSSSLRKYASLHSNQANVRYKHIGKPASTQAAPNPLNTVGQDKQADGFAEISRDSDSSSVWVLFRSSLGSIGATLVGFLLPLLACLLYLARVGAIASFLEMVEQYLPLFARINGVHVSLIGTERVTYLIQGYLALGGNYGWLLAALLSVYVALRQARLSQLQRIQIYTMLGLAVSYSFYPIVQGRFWEYHWLPFVYMLILLAGLCVLPIGSGKQYYRTLAVLVLVAVLGWQTRPPEELSYQLLGRRPPPIKAGRVDQIATYLSQHLRPGEKVQPLDWTGGALQGMLIAQAPIASRFIYSFQFYHDVDNPYIQQLCQQLMQQLQQAPPRFIIDMGDDNIRIAGIGSSPTFPELERFIQEQYYVSYQGKGYAIWERK